MSLKRVKCKHVSKSVWRDSGLPGSSIVLPTRGLGICKQPLLLLEMRSMRSVHSWILMICHRCRIPGTWKYLPTKLMLDTCMILLNTCKISSWGLLTIKALSEKDELHDMMSNKTLVEEHQISGASELLTLGFLSPTSSEGKSCKNQEALSVLAGWVWWEGIIWGSCIAFRALERNFCHCKRTPTSMEGAEGSVWYQKLNHSHPSPCHFHPAALPASLKKERKNITNWTSNQNPWGNILWFRLAQVFLDQAAQQGTESLEYR